MVLQLPLQSFSTFILNPETVTYWNESTEHGRLQTIQESEMGNECRIRPLHGLLKQNSVKAILVIILVYLWKISKNPKVTHY